MYILLFIADCIPLSMVRAGSSQADNVTISINRGSNASISSLVNPCNHTDNNNYVLVHENHDTEELDVVLEQPSHRIVVPNIQLTTAGIYCTYKQCAPEEEPQCCIKIKGWYILCMATLYHRFINLRYLGFINL